MPYCAESLKESLDIHSHFARGRFINTVLKEHFDCRIEDGSGVERPAPADRYWRQTSFLEAATTGELRCPADVHAVVMESKGLFNRAAFYVQLPDLAFDGQYVAFGFEPAMFVLERTGGADRFVACVEDYNVLVNYPMTAALPANYKTAPNVYVVVLGENQSEFYVNQRLVAVILNTATIDWGYATYPPLLIAKSQHPVSVPCIAELIAQGNGDSEVLFPLAPYHMRLSNAAFRGGRIFKLYVADQDTPLYNYTLNAGSVTSHAVPVHGYVHKTVLFYANQNGSLEVQVTAASGAWRRHSIRDTIANLLTTITMTDQVVNMRVIFTPDAYPCNVRESEVVAV